MATNVARVAIVAVIAVVLVSPFISVVDSNVGEQSVANESVTADVGNYVELDGYQLVDGSVTVEAEDGTSYSEGSDYEVDYESGELQALSGGNISDGENGLHQLRLREHQRNDDDDRGTAPAVPRTAHPGRAGESRDGPDVVPHPQNSMLLVPAVTITLVGFVVWGAGYIFNLNGLASIGAVLVVAVGAMVMTEGLEQRDGKVEEQVDSNTTEISYQTSEIDFIGSFSLGFVWMLLGGVLVMRGVDPDA
ncbi:hypothetical protein [Halomicrobium urmianum]|uniref:hypothetical protein n=1 Tax=Halomicrobium urmianum TaxID=1586233 RepID=UPI001CD93792|nr:hypothetical protein [Halomicrobium urmianum]